MTELNLFTGLGPSYPAGGSGNINSPPPSSAGSPPPQGDSISSGGTSQTVGQSYGLALRDGRISIAEFSKLVQTALDKAKQAGVETAAQNIETNKNFGLAILTEFALMKEIKEAIYALGKQAEALYQNENSQISSLNNATSSIYGGQSSDQQAISAYNQAFANFHNSNSPDYHNHGKLTQATQQYNNYADARRGEIANYDAQVDEYNGQAQETNTAFEGINDALGKFSFAGGVQMLQGQEAPVSHYQGSGLPTATGIGSLSQIGQVSGHVVGHPPAFSMNDYMDKYWGPVESYLLKQLTALAKTIDFHLNLDTFQKMKGNLEGFKPQGMLMLELMTTIMKGSGSGGGDLGLPFHSSFINRLAAKAIMSEIAAQDGVMLPKSVQAEIQHAVISAMSKGALSAAGSSGMQFLGDQLGKLNLPESAYASAMAFAYGTTIAVMVEGSALRGSALDAIGQDPNLAALPAEQKEQLADKIVAGMQLSLLSSAVMNMAISLQTPGLVSQVMFNALLGAGIDSTGSSSSINSVLSDRSSTIQAQGEIAQFLVDRGFTSEFSAKAVGEAVSNALNYGPYASTQDFVNSLSMQFKLQGLGSGTAASLAIDFTASVLGNNPTASLSGSDLDMGVMLGLVSKEVFLSSAARSSVLAGLDPQFGASYDKAVTDLLLKTNPAAVASAFASGLGSVGVMNALPPVTLGAVRDTLYANLVSQGVDGKSARSMADNFMDLVRNGEPFAITLQVNPYALGFLQASLALSLVARGLTSSDAASLAEAVTLAALSVPSGLTSTALVDGVVASLDAVNSYKISLLQLGVASALGNSKIAGSIAAEVLSKPSSDIAQLTASLRTALLGGGLGLTPGQAQELALSILNTGSLGNNLISADFAKSVLARVLVDQGIDPVVAGKIAEAAGPLLAANAAAFSAIDSALKDTLAGALTNNLSMDSSVALALVGSVDFNTVINLEKASSDFAAGLLNAGLADKDKANTLALTLLGNVLRTPDALESDLSFKRALIAATSLTLDVDTNVARDIIAKLAIGDIVLKDALINQLAGSLVANGYAAADAATMAAIAASGIIQGNQASTQVAFQNAFGTHVMASLGVPPSVAIELSRDLDIKNILIMDALQSDISSAFINTGLYSQDEAAALASNLIGLVLLDRSAFGNEVALEDAVFNNLFINMGFDREDAHQISQSLVLEGIYNRDAIADSLYVGLINAGYSPIQAEIMAIKGAETFFLINTPKLDLPASAGLAQTIALSGAFGFKEMSNSLSNILLDKGLVADSTLRLNFAEQIAAQVIVNPASFTDAQGLRDVIRDTLLSVIGTIDLETATTIANQIPITDSLRMDILQQAIINAGVTYDFF